jgi:hypothetical protein
MKELRSYILESYEEIHETGLSPEYLNKKSAAAAKQSEKLLRGSGVNTPMTTKGGAVTTPFEKSSKKYAQSLKFAAAANPPPAPKDKSLKPTDASSKYKELRKSGQGKLQARATVTAPEVGKNIGSAVSNAGRTVQAVQHGVESAAVGSGLAKKGFFTGKLKLSGTGKQIARTVGGVSKALGGPDIGAAIAPTPLQKAGQVAGAVGRTAKKVGRAIGTGARVATAPVRGVARAASGIGNALIGR